MNILVKLMGFNGGAPRSLLEYTRVLIEHGHTVFVAGSSVKQELEQLYWNIGAETVHFDSFTEAYGKKKWISIFRSCKQIEKYILDNKIDLILPVGVVETYFCSFVAEKVGCKIVGVIPGGKTNTGIIDKELESNWRVHNLVCFSRENKEGLMINGVPEEDINVVANRINTEPDYNWSEFYKVNNDNIRCFLASRFTKNKINGIKTTIDIIKDLAVKGIAIELNIAGDGEYTEEINEYAEAVNNQVGRDIIKILGFVSDPKNEYLKSHIIFGKGRGVIEPLVLRRLVVVVGEEEKFDLCNKDTFRYLFNGNFGGRNIENPMSVEDLSDVIVNIFGGSLCVSEYDSMFNEAYDEYHISHLYDKINPLIHNSNISNKRKFTVTRGIIISFNALVKAKVKKIFH